MAQAEAVTARQAEETFIRPIEQLDNEASRVPDQTTITLSVDVKRRLAQAKGDRPWDEFLSEVADAYLDEAIALAQARLEELRAHKARGLTLDEVDALRKARKGAEDGGGAKARKGRTVDAAGASGRRR